MVEVFEIVIVFYVGIKFEDGNIFVNGGCVFNVIVFGKSVIEVVEIVYKVVDLIDWLEGFCCWDIGWWVIEVEKSEDKI